MAPSLQFALGLFDLTLVNTMSAFGSSAATMLQYAALAIESGQANVVACVYADAPLAAGESISQSGYSGKRFNAPGLAGLRFAYGDYGPAYIGTTVAYAEGGYETSHRASNVAPEVEPILMDAMKRLLGAK